MSHTQYFTTLSEQNYTLMLERIASSRYSRDMKKCLILLFLVLSTVTPIIVFGFSAPAQAALSCYDIEFIWVRGSGSPKDSEDYFAY